MALQAIQTRFNGHLFRSRLEARWAVFFTALGIDYRYEPEGFDLGGVWYLPDFHLPAQHTWLEIKPGPLSAPDRVKVTAFAAAITGQRQFAEIDALADLPEFYVMSGDCWGAALDIFEDWRLSSPRLNLREEPSDGQLAICPLCDRLIVSVVWFQDDHGFTVHCIWCDMRDRRGPDGTRAYFHKGDIYSKTDPCERVREAFSAARGERFGT